jgi:geranylgeranyl pyrophosphate synthase
MANTATTTLRVKSPPPSTRYRIERLREQINRGLERLLPATSVKPQVVHEGMRYCVLSEGKRFRPLLALGACEAVGAPARAALPVACAVELIHTYSLVHDDLPAMDNADERRGQASCHRKYGEGNAILVGDALLTLGFEVLGRDGMPNALAIIRTLSRACGTNGLIGGQVLDLQAISQPSSATERILREIAEWKTAALITASVVAGALAGGGSAEHVKRLERYGRCVGVAFQLIDDVHDGEGMAQVLGRDQARTEAHQLIAQALGMLEPFGKRATLLSGLASWLSTTV